MNNTDLQEDMTIECDTATPEKVVPVEATEERIARAARYAEVMNLRQMGRGSVFTKKQVSSTTRKNKRKIAKASRKRNR